MNGKIKTRRWNIQEHLKTEEDMHGFIEAYFAEAGDDPAFITAALGEIARARHDGACPRDGPWSGYALQSALW